MLLMRINEFKKYTHIQIKYPAEILNEDFGDLFIHMISANQVDNNGNARKHLPFYLIKS